MWRAGPFKVYRSLRNGLIRRHLGVADRPDGRTQARRLRPNRAAKRPFLEKGRLQIRAREPNGVPFSANSPAAPNLVPLVFRGQRLAGNRWPTSARRNAARFCDCRENSKVMRLDAIAFDLPARETLMSTSLNQEDNVTFTPLLLRVALLTLLLQASSAASAQPSARIAAGPDAALVVADAACGPGWSRTARGTCRRTLQEPVPTPRWRPPGQQRELLRPGGEPAPVLRRAAPQELDGAPPPHLRWSPPPPPPRWQDTRPILPGGLSNPAGRP